MELSDFLFKGIVQHTETNKAHFEKSSFVQEKVNYPRFGFFSKMTLRIFPIFSFMNVFMSVFMSLINCFPGVY